MDRRSFLTTAVAATTVVVPRSVGAPEAAGALIDTNVTLFHWAVRHSWIEKPERLVEKLRRHGVVSAWTGSFDGVLHSDIAGSNARLAEACTRGGGGVLRPFGTINPTLPDWEEDVRRCHEVHGMPGVRLYPGYHGYALDDTRFARLVELAGQRGLLVQIVLSVEDERSQNPALVAPVVNAAPLPEVIEKFPAARVMVLNATSRVIAGGNPLLGRLVAAGVYFEIATLEGVAGIENLLQKTPGVRLMFGSHTPYFYFEAALLKLQESALTSAQLAAVRSGLAQQALARA